MHLSSRGIYTEVCLTVWQQLWAPQNEKEFSFGNFISSPERCFYFLICFGAEGIEGICVPPGAILSCLATQPQYHLHTRCWFGVYKCASVFVFLFKVGHRQMHISHGKSNRPWSRQRTGNILVIHYIYDVVIKFVIKIFLAVKTIKVLNIERKNACAYHTILPQRKYLQLITFDIGSSLIVLLQ